MEESLIKRVVASIKCVCGQRYELDNIGILGHEKDLWLLRVSCSACHNQYLVAAVIREEGAPEVVTDLTDAELDKFEKAGRLTVDEVLDMHSFLRDFDGDFSRLFRQK